MPEAEQLKTIATLLRSLGPDLESLKKLFRTELNYDSIVDRHISRSSLSASARDLLCDDPLIFASGGSDFHVIYCRLRSHKLSRGDERTISDSILRKYPYFLLIFSDHPGNNWHFVNIKPDPDHSKRFCIR